VHPTHERGRRYLALRRARRLGFESAESETFLRVAQVTNSEGIVELVTIYPGWYRGRTSTFTPRVYLDSTTVLTTQLYFDEAVTEAVYAGEPYFQDTGRNTFNENDRIFDESLLLTLSRDGDGYLGVMSIAVQSA
jgi:protocatechuate 3,4-dioxygenase beta subunit